MLECKSPRLLYCQSVRMPECQRARVSDCQSARVPECQRARVSECQSAIFWNYHDAKYQEWLYLWQLGRVPGRSWIRWTPAVRRLPARPAVSSARAGGMLLLQRTLCGFGRPGPDCMWGAGAGGSSREQSLHQLSRGERGQCMDWGFNVLEQWCLKVWQKVTLKILI